MYFFFEHCAGQSGEVEEAACGCESGDAAASCSLFPYIPPRRAVTCACRKRSSYFGQVAK